MSTTAAKQEYALLDVFERAGGALRREELTDRVEAYGKTTFSEENLTVYPRGLSRVVAGFERAGFLARVGPGQLQLTERGKEIRRKFYDKIVEIPQ